MPSQETQLLTACLVVRNEEQNIERCLQSVRSVTDRIVVAHDGPCDDRTLAICRKWDCFVEVRPHVGMCEGHRVWAFTQAQTDWILQIDADEFLSGDLIREMPVLLRDRAIACYELLWPYWDGHGYRTVRWPYKKALFRRDRVAYLGFPHEEVRVDGIVKRVPLVLEHRPMYDNFALSTLWSKHMKWIKIHAQYHLRDYAQLPRYPASAGPLAPHYDVIRRAPLASAPWVAIYHFMGLMLLGGIREGRYGLRNSFVQSLYYCLLGWEVFRQKQAAGRAKG